MKPVQIEAVLENCEFFRELEKDYIRQIANLCQAVAYEAGEFIFEQGDFGEDLYVIAEGRVLLERSIDLGARKGSVVIDTLGKGRVAGCWACLLGESHNLMSSACCQKPTQALTLKGSELRKLILSNTTAGFHIMERFCFLLKDRIQAAYGAMEKI